MSAPRPLPCLLFATLLAPGAAAAPSLLPADPPVLGPVRWEAMPVALVSAAEAPTTARVRISAPEGLGLRVAEVPGLEARAAGPELRLRGSLARVTEGLLGLQVRRLEHAAPGVYALALVAQVPADAPEGGDAISVPLQVVAPGAPAPGGPAPGGPRPNRPPRAWEGAARLLPGAQAELPVLTSARDPDGDRVRLEAVLPAGGGLAEAGDEGSVRYQARPGFQGLDEVAYLLGDGRGGFALGKLHVVVSDFEPPAEAVDLGPGPGEGPAALSADGRVLTYLAGGVLQRHDRVTGRTLAIPSGPSGTRAPEASRQDAAGQFRVLEEAGAAWVEDLVAGRRQELVGGAAPSISADGRSLAYRVAGVLRVGPNPLAP